MDLQTDLQMPCNTTQLKARIFRVNMKSDVKQAANLINTDALFSRLPLSLTDPTILLFSYKS